MTLLREKNNPFLLPFFLPPFFSFGGHKDSIQISVYLLVPGFTGESSIMTKEGQIRGVEESAQTRACIQVPGSKTGTVRFLALRWRPVR